MRRDVLNVVWEDKSLLLPTGTAATVENVEVWKEDARREPSDGGLVKGNSYQGRRTSRSQIRSGNLAVESLMRK